MEFARGEENLVLFLGSISKSFQFVVQQSKLDTDFVTTLANCAFLCLLSRGLSWI